MNPATAQMTLQVLTNLTGMLSDLMTTYNRARLEGRELTSEEEDKFLVADNIARTNLQRSIDRARAEQGTNK